MRDRPLTPLWPIAAAASSTSGSSGGSTGGGGAGLDMDTGVEHNWLRQGRVANFNQLVGSLKLVQYRSDTVRRAVVA